jgi:hypothetical protein
MISCSFSGGICNDKVLAMLLSSPQNVCRPWRPFYLSASTALDRAVAGTTKMLAALEPAVQKKFNSVQILSNRETRAIFIEGQLVNMPLMQVE